MTTKANGKEPKASKWRPTLKLPQKEAMMSVLIRNPKAFDALRETLLPSYFSEEDRSLAVAWQLVLDYYETAQSLPDKAILFRLIDEAVENDPEMLVQLEVDMLKDWLTLAFNPTEWDGDLATKDQYLAWAISTAKKYMAERLAVDVQESLCGQGRVAVDIPEYLDVKRQELDKVLSIGNETSLQVFSEDWDKAGGLRMFSTGIDALDHLLGGGQAPREVYGLLGPYGSCKTTAAVMLLVEAARYADAMAVEDPSRQGYAVFVSFEAPLANELRNRLLSYAGHIHRDSLERMGQNGLRQLSTAKRLRDYEKKLPLLAKAMSHGRRILGEQGRARDAINLLNRRVIVIDLSGSDLARRGQGGGGIPEIARLIRAELQRRGPAAYAQLIVVDYVLAMCRRQVAEQNLNVSMLRQVIAGTQLAARNLLANAFDCPTWLLQQLSGSANSVKGPASVYDHTDAAECKSFGENLDFAISAGKPTKEGLCQLTASKHRRTEAKEPIVVQIFGAMSRIEWQKGRYVVDRNMKTLRDKNDTHGVVTPEASPSADDDVNEVADVNDVPAGEPTAADCGDVED